MGSANLTSEPTLVTGSAFDIMGNLTEILNPSNETSEAAINEEIEALSDAQFIKHTLEIQFENVKGTT